MKTTTRIDIFLVLLERQTALIDKLAVRELELQQKVADRDWTAVESLIEEMTRISEAIAQVEEERNDTFLELAYALGGDSSFSSVLSRLPGDARESLSQRYRELKVAVLRLQSHTANMDAYLRSSLATNRTVLRELFPDFAAPGYSSDGQGRIESGTALMVNQHH